MKTKTRKKCASCKRTLSVKLFTRHRSYADGINKVCRECENGQLRKLVLAMAERIAAQSEILSRRAEKT